MTIKVCVAGATGWAGSALAKGIYLAEDLELTGADMTGSQVHSVRLPGYTLSAEIIFGMPDQKLTIRHDAGSSAEPYVEGALLAIRRVHTFTGLRRGLDQVMDLDEK